jgi:hypothetical protein
MPDRTRKRPADANRRAWEILQQATAEDEELRNTLVKTEQEGKNPAAVLLGRLGGLKGGKARAKKLTPQERSEIARVAATARWKKNEVD